MDRIRLLLKQFSLKLGLNEKDYSVLQRLSFSLDPVIHADTPYTMYLYVSLNPLTAKLFILKFHPLGVVSR